MWGQPALGVLLAAESSQLLVGFQPVLGYLMASKAGKNNRTAEAVDEKWMLYY